MDVVVVVGYSSLWTFHNVFKYFPFLIQYQNLYNNVLKFPWQWRKINFWIWQRQVWVRFSGDRVEPWQEERVAWPCWGCQGGLSPCCPSWSVPRESRGRWPDLVRCPPSYRVSETNAHTSQGVLKDHRKTNYILHTLYHMSQAVLKDHRKNRLHLTYTVPL